jgi:hypothetical protein
MVVLVAPVEFLGLIILHLQAVQVQVVLEDQDLELIMLQQVAEQDLIQVVQQVVVPLDLMQLMEPQALE